MIRIQIIKKFIPYVYSPCVRKRIVENDYLRPLLIAIIKSIKKLIKKNKNYLKIIPTDKNISYYLNSGLRTFRCNVNVRYIGCSSLSPGSSEAQQG